MCAFSVLLWENNVSFILFVLWNYTGVYFAWFGRYYLILQRRDSDSEIWYVHPVSSWDAVNEELRNWDFVFSETNARILFKYDVRRRLIQVTSGSFRDTLWIFRMLFVSKLSATLDRIKLSLWEKFCDSGFGVISSHVSRENGRTNINLHSFRSALATLVFSEELRS